MFNMLEKTQEEAVSPVIGTVLLMGLAVLLVAVLSIYVFDVFEETPEHHNVGVIAKIDDDITTITYTGGSGDNSLDYFEVNLYNNKGHRESKSLLVRGVDSNKHLKDGSYTWLSPQIGEAIEIESVPSGERITIIGYFEGGSSQLVLDRAFKE